MDNNHTAPPVEQDKYDQAIAYLTEHPDMIYESWEDPAFEPSGILFDFCTPTTHKTSAKWKGQYFQAGCLTQIRNPELAKQDDPRFVIRRRKSDGENILDFKLTKRIREDERIPITGEDIQVEHLPIFAEYQRMLDNTIRK